MTTCNVECDCGVKDCTLPIGHTGPHTCSKYEYRQWAKTRNESRYKVASAWIDGKSAKGANLATDGNMVTSYGWHRIARTAIDGQTTIKVAFDCHYSVTTTKQTAPFKAMADIVVPCESCHNGY